jgi:phosphate transport system permease protein
MQLGTRKLIDRGVTGLGIGSIVLLAAALLVFLLPIVVGGLKAFVFRGTVEYRQLMLEKFGRGDVDAIDAQLAEAAAARRPVYEMLAAYKKELTGEGESLAEAKKEFRAERRELRRQEGLADAERAKAQAEIDRRDAELDRRGARLAGHETSLAELEGLIHELLGPEPGHGVPVLWRDQYGQTRWDRAQVKLGQILNVETWVEQDDLDKPRERVLVPRADAFQGTSLAPLFPYLEDHAQAMLLPRLTFYWRFLTDTSFDAHFFGGIWPEILGTIYLTLGAMLFAVPMGVVAAIYLVEYAREGLLVRVLRTFINTLAGVPSIVFGLFGLAFFINTMHVSPSKSVVAGSMTLALLILPMVIRASEEAIRAVPGTYKEAALSLGASKWWTVLTVILPAALPGVLTGIVISMGRAAGETAPIIFTAAVSVGRPLWPWEALSQPTPALPWNIYNLCTEHEAVDEIRHVQYGMVLTLVLLVLLLNAAAIVMRARISRKLRA